MNNILSKLITDPIRFGKHFSIKFLNKKIDQLPEIRKLFVGKRGLEIGGPSRIFQKSGYIPLYPIVDNIDGVNFSTNTVWENTISKGQTYDFDGVANGYQFIQDGTDLSAIASETYDFLLSSHSLEHIANPLKAIKEWLRVLKRQGILMIIVPDRRYTFDCKRPITRLEHLLQDYENNISEKDLTHLDEIISLHDLSCDNGVNNIEDFRSRSEENFTNRCLHHHVYDLNLLHQIFDYFNLDTVVQDTAPPFHLITMARKN